MQSNLRRVTTALLVVLVSVPALAGCVAPLLRPPAHRVPDPASAAPHSRTAAPDVAPSFESKAEAYSAAVDVYEDYLRVMDAVGADGGEAPQRMDPFVTDRFASTLHVAYASMQQDAIHTTGETRIVRTELIDYRSSGEGAPRIEFEACLDLTGTRVIDGTGADVTPPQRNDHTLYRVMLTGSEDGSRLVIAAARAKAGRSCS